VVDDYLRTWRQLVVFAVARYERLLLKQQRRVLIQTNLSFLTLN